MKTQMLGGLLTICWIITILLWRNDTVIGKMQGLSYYQRNWIIPFITVLYTIMYIISLMN